MPADPQFRLLARGALETGARYGELRRLVVGDYNPDSGSLHVRKSKTGRERHTILTMDGRSFFDQLIVGQPKDCPDLRQGVAGVRAYGLHEEGDRAPPELRNCPSASTDCATHGPACQSWPGCR